MMLDANLIPAHPLRLARLTFLLFILGSFAHAACPRSPEGLPGDRAPSSSINIFAADERGMTIVAQAADGTVIAWDTATGRQSTIIECSYAIEAFALSRDAKLLLVGDSEGIGFIRLDDPAYPRKTLQLQHKGVVQIIISPDQKSALVLQPNQLSLWNISNRSKIWSWDSPHEMVAGTFRPDNSQIALSIATGIMICDASTGKPLRQMEIPEISPLVSDLAYTSNGDRIIAALNNRLIVLDSATGQRINALPAIGSDIDSVTLLDDRHQAITVGDGIVSKWDLNEGKVLINWNLRQGQVTADGRSLISNEEGTGKIEIWNLDLQKLWQTLEYHSPRN